MEKEKMGVWGRVRMAGLKNRGIIEISQDRKKGDFILVMSKGIRKRWLVFNLPEEMWRVRCSKEEVPSAVSDFLNEKIMAG